MVYIQEDNIEFYDGLVTEKKGSDFINTALRHARLAKGEVIEDGKTPEEAHWDPRIRETREKLADMEAKDRANREQ